MGESLLSFSEVLLFGREMDDLQIVRKDERRGLGSNQFLDEQLDKDPRLARIYGFSFEGQYYQLPAPTIFLVEGPGRSATDGNLPTGQGSRAPLDPDKTGVGTAEFQFSNDIKFWPYDKNDLSIRMDVSTGTLEEILLDVYFGVEAPMMAGMKVSGMKVAGMKLSGMKASGMKVAGMKVSGMKVGGSSD